MHTRADFPICVTDCAWRLSDVCARLVSTNSCFIRIHVSDVLFSSFLLLPRVNDQRRADLFVSLLPRSFSAAGSQHPRLIWEMSLLLVFLFVVIWSKRCFSSVNNELQCESSSHSQLWKLCFRWLYVVIISSSHVTRWCVCVCVSMPLSRGMLVFTWQPIREGSDAGGSGGVRAADIMLLQSGRERSERRGSRKTTDR